MKRIFTGIRNNLKASGIWEWIESILVALIIAVVIRIFIAEPYRIPSGSMRPTLIEGDIILVNKFIYGARIPFSAIRLPGLTKPKRGDVIVFIYPEDRRKNFIKRLIGFPGDIIEMKNGLIYVNDKPLDDPIFNQNIDGTVRFYYNKGMLAKENQKITVPGDSLFVLGDNSRSSLDSRYWGFVPYKNLLGKAIVIYWPLKRIRIIR